MNLAGLLCCDSVMYVLKVDCEVAKGNIRSPELMRLSSRVMSL